jgi:hypothetical protein
VVTGGPKIDDLDDVGVGESRNGLGFDPHAIGKRRSRVESVWHFEGEMLLEPPMFDHVNLTHPATPDELDEPIRRALE